MRIIGFSGKKQAGKNTAANFLFGFKMFEYEIVDYFRVDDLGRLIVPAEFEGVIKDSIFDPSSQSEFVKLYMAETIWSHVKLYSFADKLKEFCINCFGLTVEQCYGTDEQKNSLTELFWDNMPGITCDKRFKNKRGLTYHESGLMTARELLQFFGTEIGRKMHGDIWVNATINQIKRDNPEWAIITDCRFPNEVEGILKEDGRVIRLTRNPFPYDLHESEVALDEDVFDHSRFSHIIDNHEMSIEEQNKEVFNYLVNVGEISE